MVIELVLQDGETYSLIVDNSSSQELESTLRGWTGLDSISTYNPSLNTAVGWKDGKQYEACHGKFIGGWKLYDVPDAR